MPRVAFVLVSVLCAAPASAHPSDRDLGLQLGAGVLFRMPGYFAEGSDGVGGTVNLALTPAWRVGRNLHGVRLGVQVGWPAGGERMTTGHDERDASGSSVRSILTLGFQLERGGFFFTVGTGAVVNRFYEIHYDAGTDGPGARTEALWEVAHLGVGFRHRFADRISLYAAAEAGTSIITWYRAGAHAGVVAHF